ncbi:unnamed protein product [Cyprideis torosa]|uniref:Elongation of very long chain fatty acids protein n=1 Tax=Cyprideis torosa TaxID=163714 RepID=A0A7R8W914_9CRUS|nr:unnamed protein product [Cyprideis torosa]CAG0884387.1 unnamed protein product [Cyprideis torosa]
MKLSTTSNLTLGFNQLDPHANLPLHNFSQSVFQIPSTPLPVEQFFDAANCYRWLRANFPASIILSIFYIVAIFVFQDLMKTKPPIKLKIPLFLWNLSLALFSILGTYRLLPWAIKEWRTYGFHRIVCKASGPWLALLMYGSYLVLFARFFKESYGKREAKEAVTVERKKL